jgi:hypothetical protein
MKVEPHSETQPARPSRPQVSPWYTLKSLMQPRQRIPVPAPGSGSAATASAAARVATKVQVLPSRTKALESVRVGMNAEVKRLVADRAEAAAGNEERMSSRLVDVLSKELLQEFVHGVGEGHSRQHQEPTPAAVPGPRLAASGALSEPASLPETESLASEIKGKVAAAMALVERITAFIRSGRPALELTLGGAIDAQVEVERTGRNQVALQIRGRNGPPAPEDLSRIRDALAERGLKLSSLSVG